MKPVCDRRGSAFLTTSWMALACGCVLQPGSAAAQTATTTQAVPPNPAAAERADAQPGVAPNAPPTEAGDIVVVGTRASLQSAISRKRNAGTVVDSIVADDIASFPDKNVGDSLARITGVQLSRDFGEGVAISIRGVEPALNRIEINGVSQASALGERSGDFRELATELVKSIDVFKGYTADLTEGGIGGTVRVETRRPLELREPLLSVVASGQHLDLTNNWKPRGTFIAGTPSLFGSRLGVLVNVTYSDVETRQDYVSNTNWFRLADFDRSTEKTVADPLYSNFNTYESCANVGGSAASVATARRLACETQFFDWAPRVPRYRSLNRRDKRVSADFQAQYQFFDNFSGYVQAQVNDRNQILDDVNYTVDLSRFERLNYDAALPVGLNGAASRPRITPGTFTTDDNHIVTSMITQYNNVNVGGGTPNNGASGILGVSRRDFDYDQRTEYYQTGFNWNVGNVAVVGLASKSKARTVNNTNLLGYSTGVGGISIDRQNDLGVPAITFPEGFDPANPASYATARRGRNGAALFQYGPNVQYRPSDNNFDEDQFKVDLDWDVDLPLLKRIEFGGQYRKAGYLNYLGGGTRVIQAANPATGAAAVYQPSANVSIGSIVTNTPPQVPAANTVYITPAQYAAFIQANSTTTGGAPLFSGLSGFPEGVPNRLAIPNIDFAVLGNTFDLSGFDQDLVREAGGQPQIPQVRIDETIGAAYIKANFETAVFGMPLTGNAGVRYVHTFDDATGTNLRRENQLRPGTGIPGVPPIVDLGVIVAAQQISFSNGYTDFLPAANFALEALPNLILRGTYAQNLARPLPTDLVPNINCVFDIADTAADDTCTGGNPDLQPYRADQYDINLAWYPTPDTLVSAGYYYKDIKSFVVQNVVQSDVDLFGDGVLVDIRRPINGFGARLEGFEASAQTVFTFLPAPLDGFGASANFTYARALETNLTNQATNEPLNAYPGLSKYTYNASLFYDKDWLNVRVNYNRRTSWLAVAADANNGGNPIFRRGESYVDAKATFRVLPWGMSLFVEGQNLNKEFSQTFIDGARPVEYYYPGQRFYAGVQFKL